MLYHDWLRVVAEHGSALAVYEAGSGRSWTFRELADLANSEGSPSGIVFPSGHDIGFILTVLRAWQAGAITCPLEVGEPPPALLPPPFPIVHLKRTSGTTGASRCIAFSADQLSADANCIVRTMGLHPGCPNLGVISLAHSYGFSSLILPLLLHGIPLLLASSPIPAALVDASHLFADDALTLAAVPAMWRAWHEVGAIPPNIIVAISAGAPLPLQLEEAVFAADGLKIHNFLGASECGGIAYDTSPVPRRDAQYAGSPMKNVTLQINSHGCLQVHSSAVGQCTWPESDLQFGNGIFNSSDQAALNPEGGVRLIGRAGDMINVAGRKFSPETTESVLRQHPSVSECLVLGIPSGGGRGDIVTAVIESNASISQGELRAFLQERLPVWQIPRHWHFVDVLAFNSRGKLSRTEWRQKLMFPR